MKKIKESELRVIRIIDKWRDDNGDIYIKTLSKIQTRPLKLGSIKKPLNENVLRIEYSIF